MSQVKFKFEKPLGKYKAGVTVSMDESTAKGLSSYGKYTKEEKKQEAQPGK